MSSKSKNPFNAAFGVAKQDQDLLQAVVMADSFNVRFAPLTVNKPRVLLPLVNCPMIDYTLEYLKTSGFNEVFILCCVHAQQIRDYLKSSRWSTSSETSDSMVVTTVVSDGSLSLGDALRELDAKSLIHGDFVLISGDIIANLPLAKMLKKHKEQTQIDKGCIMTMVFRKAVPKHHTRCQEDEAVICVEKNTKRVLHYQKLVSLKKFELPLALFQEHKEVVVRHDVLDTHISICSKHVPTLFVDNFDFQTRDDFVKGILINEEILGHSIYLSVSDSGYAARVSNLIMYDAISQDVMQRWCYPQVPDMTFNPGGPYSYLRHNVYIQGDVVRAKACTIDKNVVIGHGTKIGEDSYIVNSVIGQNCHIGKNVKIEGTYVWNSVTIEDNCKLFSCLLADNVVIKSGCVINRGCVLSFNVVLGPDIVLKPRSLLHVDLDEGFEEESNLKKVQDLSLVGSEGLGHQYEALVESDSEGEEVLYLDTTWGQDVVSDEEEEDEISMSSTISDGDSQTGTSPVPDDTKLFYNEVLDSLIRGVEEKIKCENLVLEINSSKYAYNITMKELNSLVIKAILDIPQFKSQQPVTTAEYTKNADQLLKYFLPLLQNYIRSADSQEDCLLALEDFSLSNETFAPVLIKVLKILYDKDILEEEVVLKWFRRPTPLAEFSTAEQNALRSKVKRFIEWLQEAEEESE